MDDKRAGDGTVGKALDVLDRVARVGRPVRFAELLAMCPYPKATLYRFVQTLTNQGMLCYDPDRQAYALGVRLVRLAHTAWQQSSLAPPARPHLDRLAAELGETLHLAQLDHAQVLYVDKRKAVVPVSMYSEVGRVRPAYCTGVGKAMLAFLDAQARERAIAQQSFHVFTSATLTDAATLRAELEGVRAAGYALDREEHEPGIICVAVPIQAESGRLLGGLSLTSTTVRTTPAALASLAPRLAETAHDIAVEAQSWRFPDDQPNLKSTGTG